MEKETDGFPLTSIREIRILMQCKHPNIVFVKEVVVGSRQDDIFVVMEYVEHDLKSLLVRSFVKVNRPNIPLGGR